MNREEKLDWTTDVSHYVPDAACRPDVGQQRSPNQMSFCVFIHVPLMPDVIPVSVLVITIVSFKPAAAFTLSTKPD